MLYTMMNVREDAIELFGFADQGELNCFQAADRHHRRRSQGGHRHFVRTVPRTGGPGGGRRGLQDPDPRAGVGPKLAQRIVLEMKDKVGALQTSGGAELPQGAVVSAAGQRRRGGECPVSAGLHAGRGVRRRWKAGQRPAGGNPGRPGSQVSRQKELTDSCLIKRRIRWFSPQEGKDVDRGNGLRKPHDIRRIPARGRRRQPAASPHPGRIHRPGKGQG